MKKRLLSILLTVCLLMGLLPTVALAEDPATQTQTADFTASDNGVAALALLNAAKTTGAENSTWDSANKILILKGVDFATTAATAVKLPDGAKIVLADGTTNTITGGNTESGNCYGIFAVGNLTIEGETAGTGELTVTGGATNHKYSYGIYANVAEAGEERGNVTISGGTVTATGGTVTTTDNSFGSSCGIFASDSVTISGGIVHAEGDKVTTSDLSDHGHSYGIYVYKSVTISGGSVDAKGEDMDKTGKTNTRSYGIYADKELGSTATRYGKVKISGGTVTATGSTAKDSRGIYAGVSVTISGGSVDATGGAAYNTSYGIYAIGEGDGEVKISGGTVTATGGTVTTTTTTPTAYSCSCGIYASLTSMSITGGHVTAQTLAETGSDKAALNKEPNLDGYDYFWRTNPEAQFTDSSETQYGYNNGQTYVEFSNGYNVTLNTNDGTINSGNVTRYIFGLGATLPTDVTKAGYTFAGWYDNENFTGNPVTKITETDFGDKTFYAAWRAIPVIPTSYRIAVADSENGTVTSNRNYAYGGTTITLTVTPDEGYELGELTVTDAAGKAISVTEKGDGTFTFKLPYGNVKVAATFVATPDPVKDCTKDENCPAAKFIDVKMDWTHDGIHFCVENGLMNGTSDTTFEPEGTAARAMLVTVLYRLEGEPEVGECTFSDVPADQWYTNAVIWAAENGIVEGFDGKFEPTDDITRQEFATILYRYAKYKDYDVTASADLTAFADDQTTADWAVEAMQWAVGAGLFEGKGENNLDPTGKTTRAEMAAILYRFCENVTE